MLKSILFSAALLIIFSIIHLRINQNIFVKYGTQRKDTNEVGIVNSVNSVIFLPFSHWFDQMMHPTVQPFSEIKRPKLRRLYHRSLVQSSERKSILYDTYIESAFQTVNDKKEEFQHWTVSLDEHAPSKKLLVDEGKIFQSLENLRSRVNEVSISTSTTIDPTEKKQGNNDDSLPGLDDDNTEIPEKGSSISPQSSPKGDDDVLGIDDDVTEETQPSLPNTSKPNASPSTNTDDLLPAPVPVTTTKPTSQTDGGDENTNNNKPPEENTKPTNSHGDEDEPFEGKPITIYTPDRGDCKEDNASSNKKGSIPCAPTDLSQRCRSEEGQGQGNFVDCLEACKPSFCCIHDASPDTNQISPSCHKDPRCAAYAPCYVIWWKLHDTIGPAPFLRLQQQQDGSFYNNVNNELITKENADFFREVLLHHFQNSKALESLSDVELKQYFEDSKNWDATSILQSGP
jgi:hypothetical protein